MKRSALLTVAALAVLVATPARAGARVLTEDLAYQQADYFGQQAANVAAWPDWWDDACRRDSPWRYTCAIYLGDDASTVECWRQFDVVSPFVGTRLRTELWTRWACGPPNIAP